MATLHITKSERITLQLQSQKINTWRVYVSENMNSLGTTNTLSGRAAGSSIEWSILWDKVGAGVNTIRLTDRITNSNGTINLNLANAALSSSSTGQALYNNNLIASSDLNKQSGYITLIHPYVLVTADDFHILEFCNLKVSYPVDATKYTIVQSTADAYGYIIYLNSYIPPVTAAPFSQTAKNNVSTTSAILKAAEKAFITDPYAEGGSSEPGGGNGPFTDTSDPIVFPSLPALSALDTGFVTVYIPSLAQLLSLAQYLWTADVATLDFWKKVVADPIDLILGLNILPVSFTDSSVSPPILPPTKSVVVGFIDTEIEMYYTTSQYVEVDCGSISLGEYSGSYLDYAPYTQVEIFLPYCGVHPIKTDEVMGKTISVIYHVDLISGACVAYVMCGTSVLYQFTGNCASQIPVTAQQFGDMIRSAISIASSVGTMVATGGLSAPISAAQGISMISHGLASASSTVQSMKPEMEKSGAIGGTSGLLAIQKPYLIVTRPKQCIPEAQNTFSGYPSFVTMQLSDLQGFNVVNDIHIENVPATSAELDELERIIKEGAIY